MIRPDKIGRIKWTKTPSEFEIQSCLYQLLLDRDICVRGEVRAHQIFESKVRRCKFDLVVFDLQKKPIVIIEIKSFSRPVAQLLWDDGASTKQCSKYREFGLPLLYCGHMDFVEPTISKIQNLMALSECAA